LFVVVVVVVVVVFLLQNQHQSAVDAQTDLNLDEGRPGKTTLLHI